MPQIKHTLKLSKIQVLQKAPHKYGNFLRASIQQKQNYVIDQVQVHGKKY